MVLSLVALSFALATDAAAVSAAIGAAGGRHVVRASVVFGVFQGLMAGLGGGIGEAGASWFGAFDHHIALVLLGGLGLRAAWKAWTEEAGEAETFETWTQLLIAGVATSVDALAAGVTLPAMGLGVVLPAGVIGAITLATCLAGGTVGRKLGQRYGRPVQIVGGLVLVGIGVQVWVTHVFGG